MTTPKQSKNQTFVTLGVFFAIVAFGASYLYVGPTLHDARLLYAKNDAKVKGIQSDIDALTQAKSDLDQKKAAFAAANSTINLDNIPLTFPDTEDVPGLYLQMEDIVSKGVTAGMKDPIYQVGTPALDPTENVVQIPITISATGSFIACEAFTSVLEQNVRPVSIKSINLSQGVDKDTGKPTGTFTYTATGIVRAAALSPAYTGTNTK